MPARVIIDVGIHTQGMSFEDAGGGFFYIRTHTGNLYLTAGANGVMANPRLV